jgi:hypothetical protein
MTREISIQQSIMNSLQGKGPEAWLAYLRQFEEEKPMMGLSMDIIFQHAAPRAEKENSLDWAEVAVRSAELDARSYAEGRPEREDALLRAMRIRASLITKNGARPNHFILDKSLILEWIMKGFTLSVQTAKEKIKTFGQRMAELRNATEDEKQRFGEDLRQLRRIKNRLHVAKMLANCGELPGDPVLDEWLELHKQLP